MSAERKYNYRSFPKEKLGQTEIARGGCIDAAVGVVTLGEYGVQTIVAYPEKIVVPTGYPVNREEGEISIMDLALERRQPIVIQDFKAYNSPKVSRKFVRTK